MTQIFISYRRAESSSLATLIAKQLEANHIHTFVDTRKVDGGGLFPNRLRSAIDRADIFICLLGKTTLESDWVREEIKQAYLGKKILIPVFQESFVRPEAITEKHINALLQSDGIHVLDIKNIYVDEAIEQLEKMIRVSYQKQHPLRRWIQIITVLLLVIAILIAAILLDIRSLADAIINQIAAAPSATNVQTDTPTLSLTPTTELTATVIVDVMTSNALAATATPTPEMRIVTPDPFQLTATALIQGATARVEAMTELALTPTPFDMISSLELTATSIIQNATATSAQLTAGATSRSCLSNGDSAGLYGQLLYTRITGTKWQLYWCSLETGEEENLSPTGYHAAFGSWSPDGSKIVFLASPMLNGAPVWDVWVMNNDGSNPQQLTRTAGLEQLPIWSPQNDFILYSFQPTTDDDTDIYKMNINGDNQGSYLNTGIDGEPSLSSDAAQIAYTAKVNGQYDLYFYNRRIDQRLQLLLVDSNEYYPQWSADDSQILYYEFNSQRDLGKIYILNLESCTEQNGQLYNCDTRLLLDNKDEFADSWATWALNDKAVLFQSNRRGLDRHIFIMNADGSAEPRQITFGQNSSERFPRWRP